MKKKKVDNLKCVHHWIVTIEDHKEIGRCQKCPEVKVIRVFRDEPGEPFRLSY